MSVSSAKIFPVSSRSSEKTCPFGKKYNGLYRWNQDQAYEGEFFRESLHGEGTYKWQDLGVYEGGFYSNSKEGYGMMSFPDNSSFEGLFVRNQRFGPGVYTYSNGRQDAGFWMGRKLVRLSRSVDFIVPRLAPNPIAKIKLLQFRRLIPINEESSDLVSECYNCGCPSSYLSCPYSSLVLDPRSYFFDKAIFDKSHFLNMKPTFEEFVEDSDFWEIGNENEQEDSFTLFKRVEEEEDNLIPAHCLCADKEFVMDSHEDSPIDICEMDYSQDGDKMGILAYFTHYSTIQRLEGDSFKEKDDLEDSDVNEEDEESSKRPKLLAWNRNELSVRMLQEIFRHRAFEGKLTFNIAKLITGVRTAFRKTGKRERECLEFLKTCAFGSPEFVKAMLCNYDISEELTDARGNNSVMFAAATDQHEIINILLDYGADVNSFNDEGLTPLNLCLLRRLAQSHDIGNWETAFLPNELGKISGNYEIEEWRKQISIPNLDRIFGDGTSLRDDKQQPSSTFVRGEETPEDNSSSLTFKILPGSVEPLLSKSLLNRSMISQTEKSASRFSSSVRTVTKTDPEIAPLNNKMTEFEKSVNPLSNDSYFFELAPTKRQEKEDEEKKYSRQSSMCRADGEEEFPGEGGFFLSGLEKRLYNIDKTIKQLLRRGADPDISEVPKPSIHLGVYAKDSVIVQLLLGYGANPNCQLYSNEGLLTPLHVLVLSKSAFEYVCICDLLLRFKANPEMETHPDFTFHEEEKPHLDIAEGRTPLQLLCMRPDLEYADPEGYLIKIALLLANVSYKTRCYNGHSYLSLAMYFGNLKLLKAFLDSKFFDPNAVLENDRGTVLHVLVSTEFQKKTQFETSIDICDYLLDAGANPLKCVGDSDKLAGNCIDYGYREVEEEKAMRLALKTESEKKESEKKEVKKKGGKKVGKYEKSEYTEPEKPFVRDHLPDHLKVLDYLYKRAKEMKRKKKFGKIDGKTQAKESSTGKAKSEKFVERVGPDKGEKNESKSAINQSQKLVDRVTIMESIEKEKNSNKNGLKKSKKEEVENGVGKSDYPSDDFDTLNEGSNKSKTGEHYRKRMNDENDKKNKRTNEAEENERKKFDRKRQTNETDENERKKFDRKRQTNETDENERKKFDRKRQTNETEENERKKFDRKKQTNETEENERKKFDRKKQTNETEENEKKKLVRKKRTKERDMKETKKPDRKPKQTDSSPSKVKAQSSQSKSITGRQPCASETFPEKLRQSLLNTIGQCKNLDVNELLLPYVVLRDGDLYYDVKRKCSQYKEQYSLI